MRNEKYSTFWERLFAGMVDGVLLIPILYFDSYFLNSLSEMWTAITWLVFSRLAFVNYSVIMHWTLGQTLGKKIFNVKVIHVSENQGISLLQAIRRDGFYVFLSLTAVIIMVSNILDMGRYSLLATEPYDTYLGYVVYIWFALEMATMFQNKKKRSLHGFISDTVVVKSR